MYRLALVLSLAILSGCVTPRVSYEPAASDQEVTDAEVEGGDQLYPAVLAGRWGYVDRRGQMVIPPRFESASDFFEGRAAVQMNGEWGYITPSGQWVVEPRYASAAPFSEGRGRVSVGEGLSLRYGFVDVAGREVVPPVLYFALDYSEGLALAQVSRERSEFQVLFRVSSEFVFLNRAGTVAFEVRPEAVSAASFSGGLAPFEKDQGALRATTWGYLDRDGAVAIAPDFDGPAFRHTDGLARIGVDGQMGFVNEDGEVVIPPAYLLALPFADGLAPVQNAAGEWGFVDASGALVVEPQYRAALAFSDGLAAVQTDAGWGYVDASGDLAIPATYTRAESFRNGLARVYSGRLLRYIDADGETVWAQP